jgi:shikimate kinase
MGSGKSTVGRRLASALELPFTDADTEIKRAAGETIAEIFENRGEQAFRTGEHKVISRLLQGPRCVLATGGGAFMNPSTRDEITQRGISVWLNANLDLLMARVMRRDHRPLLKQGDPEETMRRLMDERSPIYALADITVESQEGPHAITVKKILRALDEHVPSKGVNVDPS